MVGQEIGAEDDATVQYILGGSPLLAQLQQILRQTAGFALLVMNQGGRAPVLDAPLAVASQALSSTSAELQALRVPARAGRHYHHAIEAVTAIGQAIDLVAVCLRCARDDPARAALTRRLRVATEHLRAASRLPGFGMVDLRQACCAYHANTLCTVNPQQ